MIGRWALAPAEAGGAELVALGDDGLPAGEVRREPDLVEAVRSRPHVTRWVWRSTAEVYPRLLSASVRVSRCYDVEDAEALLLGHEGRLGEPRSAAAAWARLRHAPVPSDPPHRPAEPGAQSPLFEPEQATVPFDALLEVYAEQQRRHDAAEHPGRMRLLTAAESAGMLIAAEMNEAGLPWRADVHRSLLQELLGERYAGGGRDAWRSWPKRCPAPSAAASGRTCRRTWSMPSRGPASRSGRRAAGSWRPSTIRR